jgi:CRISP-associated protein Cas1
MGIVTPVDYKHGRPREKDDALELWPTDRVQLTVQGLILRENGYCCDEGVVYYASTKQRAALNSAMRRSPRRRRQSLKRGRRRDE